MMAKHAGHCASKARWPLFYLAYSPYHPSSEELRGRLYFTGVLQIGFKLVGNVAWELAYLSAAFVSLVSIFNHVNFDFAFG